MAKKGMDDEALTIQRCARMIEDLGDEPAQARVALFLFLRYTGAGDLIVPGHGAGALPPMGTPTAAWSVGAARITHAVRAPSAPEDAASGTAPTADDDADGSDNGAADGNAEPSGWDISGMGSEHDDEPEGAPVSDDNAEVEI